jgi:hypothetical protein
VENFAATRVNAQSSSAFEWALLIRMLGANDGSA